MMKVDECGTVRETVAAISIRARYIGAIGKVVGRVVVDDDEGHIAKADTEVSFWPSVGDLGLMVELAGELAQDIERLASTPVLTRRG